MDPLVSDISLKYGPHGFGYLWTPWFGNMDPMDNIHVL
jgi:hypothetical protein